MADREYGAGEDIPGTPRPFPFDLVAGVSGVTALAMGLVALFVEPWVVYGYWLIALDWLALSVLATLRGEQPRLIWLGGVGVLAPLAVSVILGSNVLIQIPG